MWEVLIAYVFINANRSRCFAFLVFKEKESVEKVISKSICSKIILVNFSSPNLYGIIRQVLGGGGDHAINSKKVYIVKIGNFLNSFNLRFLFRWM